MIAFIGVLLLAAPARADEPPPRADVAAALRKAAGFFHARVARHGGYVYRVSGDLALREAEGTTGPHTIWVQPPGTPAVGEAFLDAYRATGDKFYLDAARDAGRALRLGQLHSGGWFYRVEFDPRDRAAFAYRVDLDGKPLPDPTTAADRGASGWDVWKRRRFKGNVSTFDDDTTHAALRFLMRLDQALTFKDAEVHESAEYGLKALLGVQYPNGGWSANFDRFPAAPSAVDKYPVKKASYPETWPRNWPKDFTGCYVTNDDLTARAIDTLLTAHAVYGDRRYREAAEKAGRFLLLAQMPDPQPAWAQQYNRDMQPVWDRAFEPAAISGRESQTVLETLLRLARETGDANYLEPIPRAVAYLRKSQLPDGRLARFYELKTNRPLYFTRGPGGRHEMTYSADRLTTNYAFIVDSRLDAIEAEYRRQVEKRPAPPAAHPSAAEVRRIIAALDERGVWVERGRLRHHNVEPKSGIIDSATFAQNVRTLSRYLVEE